MSGENGPRWRRYLRFWGPDVAGDVNDELSFHYEMLVQEYRAAGLKEEQARVEASKRFGRYQQFEQDCMTIGEETVRMSRRKERFGSFVQDLRFGFRQLRANPVPTVVAIITLALGIGANTAIFSVVNGVLLRPLPYRDADRLVMTGMSMPDYRDVMARSQAFDATTTFATNIYTIRDDLNPEEIRGAIVEPAFFEMLAQPALGRAFTEAESRSTVAVISDGLWRRRYAARSDVAGQSLDLGGKPYTIIGVMPRGFDFPAAEFDVWVPLNEAMAATPLQLENRLLRIFRVVAHLAPGITVDQANAELEPISQALMRAHPDTNEGVIYTVASLYDVIVGGIRLALLILLGVVGLVLLIACVNVANLLLGVTAARSREIAVRRALGASRARLIRQLITESVVLGTLGGAAGILLALLLVRLLPLLVVDLPRLAEITLDTRVLLFGFSVSVLTAVLFGIAPAVQGSRGDLNDVLRDGGRGAAGARRGGILRSGLVIAEVALCAIVLVGAGLLLQSLSRVLNQDIGFNAENLVSANTGLFYFDDPAERSVKLQEALQRIAAVPGVVGAAAGTGLPPQTAQRATGFTVAGREPDEAERDGAFWMAVTPGYFNVLGTRIVNGREFTDSDVAGSMPVAIISETLAQTLFGRNDPVGQRVRLTNSDQEQVWRTIVGVVADVRYRGVEDAAANSIYTAFPQTPFAWAYVVIRSNQPAAALTRPVREAVAGVDPRMVPARVRQHTEVVSDLVAQRRFVTLLLTGFAVLALTLAAVGIYGVIAYSVVQRRREIGVRIALGARPATVLRGVITRALSLSAAGVVAGILASLWLTRFLATLLYDMDAINPPTFAAGALVIAFVAIVASSIPAWRAARVDPLTALRE